MFSRQQYMSNECSHSEYYSQFITPSARLIVVNSIGRDRIISSTDPHFNDIPLYLWYKLSFPVKSLKEAGDFLTLVGKVCIAKEIARQYKASKSNV